MRGMYNVRDALDILPPLMPCRLQGGLRAGKHALDISLLSGLVGTTAQTRRISFAAFLVSAAQFWPGLFGVFGIFARLLPALALRTMGKGSVASHFALPTAVAGYLRLHDLSHFDKIEAVVEHGRIQLLCRSSLAGGHGRITPRPTPQSPQFIIHMMILARWLSAMEHWGFVGLMSSDKLQRQTGIIQDEPQIYPQPMINGPF